MLHLDPAWASPVQAKPVASPDWEGKSRVHVWGPELLDRCTTEITSPFPSRTNTGKYHLHLPPPIPCGGLGRRIWNLDSWRGALAAPFLHLAWGQCLFVMDACRLLPVISTTEQKGSRIAKKKRRTKGIETLRTWLSGSGLGTGWPWMGWAHTWPMRNNKKIIYWMTASRCV